jgi:predicted RNase H-like HicB family nuclease
MDNDLKLYKEAQALSPNERKKLNNLLVDSLNVTAQDKVRHDKKWNGFGSLHLGKGIDQINQSMEKIINIHIEKLPEGLYLATSDEVQGLIAQGRTITETLEIARDVAKKLLESQDQSINAKDVKDKFDYPLVINT